MNEVGLHKLPVMTRVGIFSGILKDLGCSGVVYVQWYKVIIEFLNDVVW